MKNDKFLKETDSWILGEDIPDIDLFFSQIWLSCFVNEFARPSGRAYKRILCIYRGYHLWFYYGKEDSYEVGESIVRKFLRRPKFIKQVNRQIVVWADKLRHYSENLPETNLERLSNKKLWALYLGHDKLHTEYYQWGWIPVAADMFHNNLTVRLKDILNNRKVPADKINEVFVTLTQPTHKSLIQVEREEFLKLTAALQTDKYHRKIFADLYNKFTAFNDAKFGYQTHTREYEMLLEQQVANLADKIKLPFLKRIQVHYAKYFYVNHMWVGEVHSFEYYLKELAKIIGNNVKAADILKKGSSDFRKSIKKRKTFLHRYHISGMYKSLFDGFGDFMVTKIYRRFAQIYDLYKMEFILKEISRRLGLTLREVRFMLPTEIKTALLTGKLNKLQIKKRLKMCVLVEEYDQEKLYVGSQAYKLAKEAENVKVEQVNELNGQTGCVGKAQGVVKIIIRPSDIAKMKRGDILLSIATDPDIVPAMKLAAAIVTEQGGVTSHAAIVARELGIPCLIGTKIATKVFKDGDTVVVDATKGIIKRLR